MEPIRKVLSTLTWEDNLVQALATVWPEYNPELPPFAGRVTIFSTAGKHDLPWVWKLLQLEQADALWEESARAFQVHLDIVWADDVEELLSELASRATAQLAALNDHIGRRRELFNRVFIPRSYWGMS